MSSDIATADRRLLDAEIELALVRLQLRPHRLVVGILTSIFVVGLVFAAALGLGLLH